LQSIRRVYSGAPHRFLFNRLLRIYPTYWALCVIASAICVVYSHPEFNVTARTALANLSIVLAERLPSHELRWISVVWAVGVELLFYFVAAVVGYADHFASRRGKLKSGWLIGASGAGFCLLYVYAWSTDLSQHPILRRVPFLGFAYYCWLSYRRIGSLLIGLVVILIAFHSYVAYNVAAATNVFLTTLVFAFSVAILGSLAVVFRVSRQWENIDQRLGDVTYALCLID